MPGKSDYEKRRRNSKFIDRTDDEFDLYGDDDWDGEEEEEDRSQFESIRHGDRNLPLVRRGNLANPLPEDDRDRKIKELLAEREKKDKAIKKMATNYNQLSGDLKILQDNMEKGGEDNDLINDIRRELRELTADKSKQTPVEIIDGPLKDERDINKDFYTVGFRSVSYKPTSKHFIFYTVPGLQYEHIPKQEDLVEAIEEYGPRVYYIKKNGGSVAKKIDARSVEGEQKNPLKDELFMNWLAKEDGKDWTVDEEGNPILKKDFKDTNNGEETLNNFPILREEGSLTVDQVSKMLDDRDKKRREEEKDKLIRDMANKITVLESGGGGGKSTEEKMAIMFGAVGALINPPGKTQTSELDQIIKYKQAFGNEDKEMNGLFKDVVRDTLLNKNKGNGDDGQDPFKKRMGEMKEMNEYFVFMNNMRGGGGSESDVTGVDYIREIRKGVKDIGEMGIGALMGESSVSASDVEKELAGLKNLKEEDLNLTDLLSKEEADSMGKKESANKMIMEGMPSKLVGMSRDEQYKSALFLRDEAVRIVGNKVFGMLPGAVKMGIKPELVVSLVKKYDKPQFQDDIRIIKALASKDYKNAMIDINGIMDQYLWAATVLGKSKKNAKIVKRIVGFKKVMRSDKGIKTMKAIHEKLFKIYGPEKGAIEVPSRDIIDIEESPKDNRYKQEEVVEYEEDDDEEDDGDDRFKLHF